MTDIKNEAKELKKYIESPSSYSSLPYYKTKTFKLPRDMIILKDSEFDEDLLNDYMDDPYFKLVHDLKYVQEYKLPGNLEFKDCSPEAFSKHINSCYEEIGVSVEDLKSYRSKKVYNSDLWICIYDNEKDTIAATGIAEFDSQAHEGILDWIQVSKEYRGLGIGKILVNELLKRLKDLALYATVSGRVNNPAKPEYLYKSCGFKDRVIWHILKKKTKI